LTVRRWEAAVVRLQNEQRLAVAAGRWLTGPTDFVGVLGRSRDELTHSRLLGWLLDATAQHGLGDRLLTLLLAEVNPRLMNDSGPSTAARVDLELSRADSRADIVVTFGTGVAMMIEVKIDAAEQPDQCKRLADDHPDATWVFLTPTGRPPTTARPEELADWRLLSWRRVRTLLGEALAGPGVPGPARHIAEQYKSTLERLFP
jgi:hypothetical protein